MQTSSRLNGIGEYYFSQKLREIEELNRQGRQVINLGIGSPDLPPHPSVIETLQVESAKPGNHAYQSYKGSPVLRQAISDWYHHIYGVHLDPQGEILPLIGSKEGIMHVCMTYLNRGDEVLLPNPGYPTYRSAVRLAGGKPKDYTLLSRNNYEPDFERLSKQNLKKVKLMFVNYPHMPTGKLPTKELFERIIRFAQEHGILVVHDNPYSFILNDSPMSILSVPGAMDVAVELNSLSKSHNMAGWRVGMLCGSSQRVEETLRFKSNMDSGMFLSIQLAAAKALGLGTDWQDEVNGVYRERKKKVEELLKLLKCRMPGEQAGLFTWARVPSQYKDGYELSDAVLKGANVFITPGGIFGSAGEKYIRVSLCATVEKISEAITRVKNFLSSEHDRTTSKSTLK